MFDTRPIPPPKMAPSFVREYRRYDHMFAGFERRLLDACVPRQGLHVLDVGCGAGTMSLASAQRVAPEGLVLGIDSDSDAIAIASRRGRMALLPQAQFRCLDAATANFAESRFDRVISRFGALDFADPVSAFANIRRALEPRGQLGMLCWRGPARNPWATRPLSVLSSLWSHELPRPRMGSGPFALADADRIETILNAAGYDQVCIESVDGSVLLGCDIEDVVEFFFETDLRALDAHINADRARALAGRLTKALTDWQRPDGVRAPASAWLVTAERRD